VTPSNVLIGCPLYERTMHFGSAKAIWRTASRVHRVEVCKQKASLLATNCNFLWCTALNYRESKNLHWFAMLHADIEPDAWWIDTLIAEASKYDADMMSAIVPIKDHVGVTSTALAKPGSRYGNFCRLTQAQVRHASFPDTFGIHEAVDALSRLPETLRVVDAPREALMVNTGCFVCRLDRPWCEQVWFEQYDAIEKREGLWSPVYQSEDWNFSRHIAELGGKVMATRLVNVHHFGDAEFLSDAVWGAPRDPESQFG
jgi:hypothetical protein